MEQSVSSPVTTIPPTQAYSSCLSISQLRSPITVSFPTHSTRLACSPKANLQADWLPSQRGYKLGLVRLYNDDDYHHDGDDDDVDDDDDDIGDRPLFW